MKAFLFAFLLIYTPHAQSAEANSEPIYKGKPLSHWVQILTGPPTLSGPWSNISDIPEGYQAQEALQHIGSNAIPFLIKRLSPDESWTEGAVQAFRILGPVARSAIPELAFMVTNQLTDLSERVRKQAARLGYGAIAVNQADATQLPSGGVMTIGYYPLAALGCIGTEALPTLLMILSNNVVGIRLPTIAAISRMGTNATPSVPALIQCLNDPNENVARAAIPILGVARTESGFAALTNLLQTQPGLRYETLEALANFGDRGVPFLIAALSDKDFGTRFRASNKLIQVSPKTLTNAAVMTLLGSELHSPDSELCDWAALMIRAADQIARSQKPEYLYSVPMGDMNPIRAKATNALLRLAPELLR